MQSTQITLHNVGRSPSLSARIRELSERLANHHPRILNVRVAISHDTRRPTKDGTYSVVVRVRIPGRELVASHEHDGDVYMAARDAFNAMRRELEHAAEAARQDARRKAIAEVER